MGSYPASRVEVEDVIQVGPCRGPVAEPALPDHQGTLNLVYVCISCGRRHLLLARPAKLVTVLLRAPSRASTSDVRKGTALNA